MAEERPLSNGNHIEDDDLTRAEAAKNAANEHFKGTDGDTHGSFIFLSDAFCEMLCNRYDLE
jgi:hypothetical protein